MTLREDPLGLDAAVTNLGIAAVPHAQSEGQAAESQRERRAAALGDRRVVLWLDRLGLESLEVEARLNSPAHRDLAVGAFHAPGELVPVDRPRRPARHRVDYADRAGLGR